MAESQATTEPTLEPSLEDLATEAAALLDSLPTYVSDNTIRYAQQMAFALREGIKNSHANSRVSVPSIAPVVDTKGLIEWLALLVTALEADHKYDYKEWGQFIMGAENWADRLRATLIPPEAHWDYCEGNSCEHCKRDDCTCPHHAAATVAPQEQSERVCIHCGREDTNPDYCGKQRGLQKCVFTAPASPAALSDEPEICVKCGHDAGVDAVGICLFGISNSDVKTWDCACRCEFKPAITPPSTAAAKIADQLIPHLDHAFLLTKGWRDQIVSIIERSLSSGS